MRILSGMQPSGKAHIGNYLGAMRQHVSMQNEGDCYYFLANYHALTTIRDSEKLRTLTLDLAADYLALGIDPTKTSFFTQSDIPELAELTWIFDTISPIGLLERAHAWKDAKQKGKKDMTVGLFNYPVLMACDILMYSPDKVPVGQDQKQHVEITNDIAGYFNNTFGETFKQVEVIIKEDVAVVPGTDGQKMSKSYGNVIELFADEATIKKQVMGIKTDSLGVNDPKNPDECIPFQLMKHFVSKETEQKVHEHLVKGGLGYGDLKKQLLEALLSYFADARARRAELIKKPDYIHDVLAEGAKKARVLAQQKMAEVRQKVGLV